MNKVRDPTLDYKFLIIKDFHSNKDYLTQVTIFQDICTVRRQVRQTRIQSPLRLNKVMLTHAKVEKR